MDRVLQKGSPHCPQDRDSTRVPLVVHSARGDLPCARPCARALLPGQHSTIFLGQEGPCATDAGQDL